MARPPRPQKAPRNPMREAGRNRPIRLAQDVSLASRFKFAGVGTLVRVEPSEERPFGWAWEEHKRSGGPPCPIRGWSKADGSLVRWRVARTWRVMLGSWVASLIRSLGVSWLMRSL